MKTNGNDPVNPVVEYYNEVPIGILSTGMTIRQQFAMVAMQALVGLRSYDNQPVYDLNKKIVEDGADWSVYRNQDHADKSRLATGMILANAAVFTADCLIAALNKEVTN